MMNGQISAALVVTVAMILFAGSAADRAGGQTSRQTELSAATGQDNGQQGGRPQNPDETRRDDSRRDDTRRPDDDRARRDDRGSYVPAQGERVTLAPDTIISVRIADEI